MPKKRETENRDILVVCYNRLAEMYKDEKNSKSSSKAIRILKKAIALMPEDFNSRYLLGLMYHRKKDYLNMVEEYEKALKINPNHKYANFNLGVAYINQERFADAYKVFTKITEKIDSSDAEALALQGQTLEAAVNDYNQKGTSFFTNEEFDKAEAAFKKTLELDPRNEIAKNYLKKAEGIIENGYRENMDRARNLLKKKKQVEAAEAVDTALNYKPDDKEAKKLRRQLSGEIKKLVAVYLKNGDKALANGDYDTAEKEYEKAYKYKSGKVKALAKLKKLKIEYKDAFAKVMADAKRFEAKKEYRIALGKYKAALRYKKNSTTALAGVARMNTSISDTVKLYNIKGEKDFSAGNKKSARKWFDKSLSLDPNDETANSFIKKITGTQSQAKLNAEEVKKLYYKGVDFYVNNQIEQAIDAWSRLLKMDSDHQDAKRNISRAKAKLAALKRLRS